MTPDVTPIPTSYAVAAAQVRDAQQALYANYTDLPPVPWANLHDLTGPIIPGDLWVVGARPANGKTTVMLNLFETLVRAGFPTLYIGAGSEGAPADLRRQWAALRLGYRADLVLEGRWDLLPAGAQGRVFEELQGQSVGDHQVAHFADVGQKLTPQTLVTAVKEFSHQDGARYVILDHIHRVRFTTSQDTRKCLGEAVRWLRDQAAERQWGLVIAAQLHRAAQTGGTLRDLLPPVMSDLKETGTLEEEAVVGLLLHRVKRPDATPQQVAAVAKGERPISDILAPDCMAVRVGKHRRRGHIMDHTAFLTVASSGRLTARAESWRIPLPREPGEDLPF